MMSQMAGHNASVQMRELWAQMPKNDVVLQPFFVTLSKKPTSFLKLNSIFARCFSELEIKAIPARSWVCGHCSILTDIYHTC